MARLPRRRLALVTAALALPAAAPPAAEAADRDCSDFPDQAAAQVHYLALGGPAADPDRLDADRDGVACQALPCPCSTAKAQPQRPRAKHRRLKIRGARVVRVIDGDTIRVRRGRRRPFTVRLLGIDTPETKKPRTKVECGGRHAARHLRRLSFRRGKGRRVTLVTDPTQDRRDRYGRLLAYAKVDSGKWLGREQLRAGRGTVYVFETAFSRLRTYRRVERAAERRRRGVWRRCRGDFHRSG